MLYGHVPKKIVLNKKDITECMLMLNLISNAGCASMLSQCVSYDLCDLNG